MSYLIKSLVQMLGSANFPIYKLDVRKIHINEFSLFFRLAFTSPFYGIQNRLLRTGTMKFHCQEERIWLQT